MKEERIRKVTFFSKEPLVCPVCEFNFYREDLLSGSGRLIAGELTDELRRLYEPSKKYGKIVPLVYSALVCPGCLFAAYPKDFDAVSTEPETVAALQEQRSKRESSAGLIFERLDFSRSRTLAEGSASYYLAVMCYEHFKKDYSPTIKQGISALRAAWLFGELHRERPNENYDYVSSLFYRKARFFYDQALEKEQTGQQSMSSVSQLGPDIDKNYGYEGVLYLTAMLEYKYGPKKNPGKRIENLERAKKVISKVHGMGKASRSKPSTILEKTKDLFALIGEEVKALKGEQEDEI